MERDYVFCKQKSWLWLENKLLFLTLPYDPIDDMNDDYRESEETIVLAKDKAMESKTRPPYIFLFLRKRGASSVEYHSEFKNVSCPGFRSSSQQYVETFTSRLFSFIPNI